MAIRMCKDSEDVLGRDAAKCNSRSLFFDRFSDPEARDEGRRGWFEQAAARSADVRKSASWLNWILGMKEPKEVIFAQLQSRLMVNMAGGVMENAGLCLDRFGMPYIPGSAVKGCARRMAIQELADEPDPVKKAELLAGIALVFGWGASDWEGGRKNGKDGRAGEFKSDFEYACLSEKDRESETPETGRPEACPTWLEVRRVAAEKLLERLGIRKRLFEKEPWKDLPSFGGMAGFLAGYPVSLGISGETPAGVLELDVLTNHHRKYYEGKESREDAFDDEDPNPVSFLAVKSGQMFVFLIRPIRDCSTEHLQAARKWLCSGIETFGLGAKTAAGYGWFTASDGFQMRARESVQARQREEQEAKRRAEEKERQQLEEAERARKRAEEKQRTEGMSPEELEDYKLEQMNESQLRQHIEKIQKLAGPGQDAVYRLLKDRKVELWREIRALAEKGKQKERRRWTPVVSVLFRLAKDRKEKMPA